MFLPSSALLFLSPIYSISILYLIRNGNARVRASIHSDAGSLCLRTSPACSPHGPSKNNEHNFLPPRPVARCTAMSAFSSSSPSRSQRHDVRTVHRAPLSPHCSLTPYPPPPPRPPPSSISTASEHRWPSSSLSTMLTECCASADRCMWLGGQERGCRWLG
jgi:hypothetical protein